MVLATVLLLGAANLRQVDTSLVELGEIGLQKNMASLTTSARAVHALTIEHLKADIKFMDRELYRLGYPEVSRRITTDIAATDVIGGATLTVSAPKLVFGPETMDEKGPSWPASRRCSGARLWSAPWCPRAWWRWRPPP